MQEKAFVFAEAPRSARRRSRDTFVFVAEAANLAGGSRASRGLRFPAWRGHGHAPLATAAVAAVRMRMTGCQARTNEVAKEVHGPSPQSSAAAPRGKGRMRLVEAGTSRPGAVATDRFDFCRRHPMQADHGGATRVYVHGYLEWRTVPAGATRPFGARIVPALRGCRQPFETRSIARRMSVGHAEPKPRNGFPKLKESTTQRTPDPAASS